MNWKFFFAGFIGAGTPGFIFITYALIRYRLDARARRRRFGL